MTGINLVIAVTDGDWFEMLRLQPNLGEVNFWAPSAANFRSLQPGDLTPSERTVVLAEGWILGVPGLIREGQDDHAGDARG